MVKVNVYAASLYVEESIAAERFKAFHGKSAKELSQSQAYYDTLLSNDQPWPRTLSLTFARYGKRRGYRWMTHLLL